MSDWTPEMDRRLLAAVKRGQSRREFARKNGLSENACIARYNRLKGVRFQSDINRLAALRAATAAKRNQKHKQEVTALKRVRGLARDAAIAKARMLGVRLSVLGDKFGMTGERARQIALRADVVERLSQLKRAFAT